MKATGVVRRIDELGRIVIPKEIRRTLHIRETDPLEIYTDREGQVILKKYSPIGEITEIAEKFAKTLSQVSGHGVAISDREKFISCAGGTAKLFLGKRISRKLQEQMEKRESCLAGKGERNYIPLSDEIDDPYLYEAVVPIICQGDVIGTVCLLQEDRRKKLGEIELKLSMAAAIFLGKQMEN